MSDSIFQHVDVLTMARRLKLDPYPLYYALEIDMDPWSKRHWDKVMQPHESEEEGQQALTEMFEYISEFTGEPDEIENPTFGVASEDFSNLMNQAGSEPKVSWDKSQAIYMSRIRVKTGVPWGTPVQIQKISEKAWATYSVDELQEILKNIPLPSDEWVVVIRIMARFFMRYQV
jgi:hypothetical protein